MAYVPKDVKFTAKAAINAAADDSSMVNRQSTPPQALNK
jgi:hypothetical protein